MNKIELLAALVGFGLFFGLGYISGRGGAILLDCPTNYHSEAPHVRPQ